jgi:hypothetical protein
MKTITVDALLRMPHHPALDVFPDVSEMEIETWAKGFNPRLMPAIWIQPIHGLHTSYRILDGRQRLRLLKLHSKRTGWSLANRVNVEIRDGPEDEILALICSLNLIRRHFTPKAISSIEGPP